MELHERTAVVVHLDALAGNIEKTKTLLPPGAEIIGVVKADAYGLGAAGVWRTMRSHGIRRFAAAYWQEGAALRAAGAEEEEILLLADTWDDELPKLIEHRLTPALFDLGTAEKLNVLAAAAGVIQPVQLKIDTGMHRIGFPAGVDAVAAAKGIAAMENLQITGAFTHFARADEPDCDETERQFARFMDTVAAIRAAGVELPMIHAANSAALILRPETALDAVRVGDILYGLITVDDAPWDALGLREIISWHTRVAFVKRVPAGSAIGYGGTYVTDRETVVATIPVGYTDGYSRGLTNQGKVLIRGKEVPIIGRVCMDQFMVDVTDLPGIERGEPVTLLGEGLTVRRVAEMAGISVDEFVCGITKRVPRYYTEK